MDIVIDIGISDRLSHKILANRANRERLNLSGPGTDSMWFLARKWLGLRGCRGIVVTNQSTHMLSTHRDLSIKRLRSVLHKDLSCIRCEFRPTVGCFRIGLGGAHKKPLACLVFNAEWRIEDSQANSFYRYSKAQIDAIANSLLMLNCCAASPTISDGDAEVFAKVLTIINDIGTQPDDRRHLLFSALAEAFAYALRKANYRVVWDRFTLQVDRQTRRTVTNLSGLFRAGIEYSKTPEEMQHEIDALIWLVNVIEARQSLWSTLCEDQQDIQAGPIPAKEICPRLWECWREAQEARGQISHRKPLTGFLDQIGSDLAAVRTGNLPTKGFYARRAWQIVAKELDSILAMLPAGTPSSGQLQGL